MLPVAARTRPSTTPTASSARNASTMPAGCAHECSVPASSSRPLRGVTCAGAMWWLARKCVAAYNSAVSSTARRVPDSRSIAVCIAPRRNVSSMNATAKPLTRRSAASRSRSAPLKSAAGVHSSSPSALIKPTTASMLATPRMSASDISRRNARRGSPYPRLVRSASLRCRAMSTNPTSNASMPMRSPTRWNGKSKKGCSSVHAG